MKKLLEHKGYRGTVDFDAEEGTLFGKVLCIESMLMYHGESVQEITDAFVNVLDDYLAHCAKRDIQFSSLPLEKLVEKLEKDIVECIEWRLSNG